MFGFENCSQLLDNLSEERRCLIVKGKEDFEKDVHAWEKRLRNDFNNLAENIVCPFHDRNQALIQFSSENGLFYFLPLVSKSECCI